MNLLKTILSWALGILFFVITAYKTGAQNPIKNSADSLKFTAVQLTEISIRSAETIVKTENILMNLISDEEIAAIKVSNDSIFTGIYKENEDFFNNRFESNSIRYLETCMLRIKNQKSIVDNERDKLTAILKDLVKSIEYINNEKEIWSKTRIEILNSEFSETLINRLDAINENLNNASAVVMQRTGNVIESLDKSSELTIKMAIILSNLQKSINKLTEQRLKNDYPNILDLDYSGGNLKFTEVYRISLITEWQELKNYVSSKINELLITLFLFVLILYLFYKNQVLFARYQKNTENM